jgi:hypothetical protein
MTCNCDTARHFIKRLAESLQEFIDYEPVGYVEFEQDLIDDAREFLKNTEPPEQISEEENDRRLKSCLESIRNLTHKDVVDLMGEDFLKEFRRVSLR